MINFVSFYWIRKQITKEFEEKPESRNNKDKNYNGFIRKTQV